MTDEKVLPVLDGKSLAKVRTAVQSIADGKRTGVVALVAAAGDNRMTVDFDAEKTLGHPLVVVEPPLPVPSWWSTLSTREQQVCDALRVGKRNREIAQELFISVATVKDHVHSILSKAGAKSRNEIAAAFGR